jgi:hypothetical protein
MRQKHLMVFEILKPACLLCGASKPIIIMDNDIWSLGNIADHMTDALLVSETLHCGSGVVYKNSVLLLYSVVSKLSFKDAMLLATIISCCEYKNGVKKDQCRKDSKTTRTSKFRSYTRQCGEGKRHRTAKSTTVSSVVSSRPSLKGQKPPPNSAQ